MFNTIKHSIYIIEINIIILYNDVEIASKTELGKGSTNAKRIQRE